MAKKCCGCDGSTKDRILDWAEQLFALKGVKGTSVRELCAKAGVNIGAVNYYFGSKEGLVRAVLSRRLGPLNMARRQRLEAFLAQWEENRCRPGVEEVVRAFVEPAFALLESGEGARHFVSMLGRAFADPDPSVKWLFLEEMVPVFRLFFQVMAVALPDLPPERLFWRLHFLIGSMGHILAGRFAGKGERGALSFFDLPAGLSSEQVSGVDIQEELIRFVSAGLEA